MLPNAANCLQSILPVWYRQSLVIFEGSIAKGTIMNAGFLRLLLLMLATHALLGCVEKEFDPADPAKSFTIARDPYDDKDWERAVTRLGEFKSRFPYSQYAVEAELLIANAQFELQRFAEAGASYEQFVKLHPKHAKVDFAMYRVGECDWAQSPEEIDREQDYTIKAIEDWTKLVDKFPNSEHTGKAKQYIAEGTKRLADSHQFISNFYCKMELYHACAYRFIKLAKEYKQFKDMRVDALKQAANAMEELAKQKGEDMTSDKNIYFRDFSPDQLRAKATELRSEAEKS